MEKIVDSAVDFLKKINVDDKVLIVHAHDNDSVCSAAIMYKLLGKFLKKEPKLFMTETNFSVTENDLKKIMKSDASSIVILDISDINVGIATKLTKSRNVMIVDHHKPKGYARITYVNPRVYDSEVYLPTSYICYKIFERLADPKEIIWIAGAGTLSDMGIKHTQDLFQKIKLVDPDLVGDSNPVDEELFDNSSLGKLAKILDSARVVKGVEGVTLVLNTLLATKNYNEILEGKTADCKKLIGYFEIVEKEFKRIVANFQKNKKQIKNFLVYELKSKMNLKSPVASYLPKLFDDKILIIMQKEGTFTNVSLRRGKNVTVDLADLAAVLVKDIPGSNGGGHPVAAGAGFPNKYAKTFMKNLSEISKK